MDYDRTDASSAFQGRLVFEPYFTSGGGSIAQNTWYSYDTLAGKWYGSGTPIVGGSATTQECTQATPCTWNQVLADYPDAGIGTGLNSGILFRVGGAPGIGMTGQVDDFTIGVNSNDKTYDFDPAGAANTVIVGPKQVNVPGAKFFTLNDTGNGVATETLVPGPGTPPLGAGSLQLSADATSAPMLAHVDPALAGLPLSQLTALELLERPHDVEPVEHDHALPADQHRLRRHRRDDVVPGPVDVPAVQLGRQHDHPEQVVDVERARREVVRQRRLADRRRQPGGAGVPAVGSVHVGPGARRLPERGGADRGVQRHLPA